MEKLLLFRWSDAVVGCSFAVASCCSRCSCCFCSRCSCSRAAAVCAGFFSSHISTYICSCFTNYSNDLIYFSGIPASTPIYNKVLLHILPLPWCFISFHISQHIISFYKIAYFFIPGYNLSFRHRIAQQRHTDFFCTAGKSTFAGRSCSCRSSR